jgi:hypothetical protein
VNHCITGSLAREGDDKTTKKTTFIGNKKGRRLSDLHELKKTGG